MRAIVEDFEQDGWEERLFVCNGGWRRRDLKDGFKCEPELADGEIVGEDL